ncbi:MAG: hypothetical protein JRJ64_14690, partial [Deltaproteobacteria bacterium]|nr:hypothetical protein [Deltaproteobacteria bacterium]
KLIRYLGAGAQRWALAGIHYLVWGRMASRIPWLRRRAYSRFGPHPTSAVQRRPQMVALEHLATADEALLLKLARRVWERQAPDQVITREDLDWIRARSPGIKIIVSSASPKAMLDVAVKTNVLAITDTSYGEDHCWTEHFACVVDINSPTPFSPIVPQASPTRAVHSATVLTREEQRRRATGAAGYLDARRKERAPMAMVELDGEALRSLLGDLLAETNQFATQVAPLRQRWEVAHALTKLAETSRAVLTVP